MDLIKRVYNYFWPSFRNIKDRLGNTWGSLPKYDVKEHNDYIIVPPDTMSHPVMTYQDELGRNYLFIRMSGYEVDGSKNTYCQTIFQRHVNDHKVLPNYWTSADWFELIRFSSVLNEKDHEFLYNLIINKDIDVTKIDYPTFNGNLYGVKGNIISKSKIVRIVVE